MSSILERNASIESDERTEPNSTDNGINLIKKVNKRCLLRSLGWFIKTNTLSNYLIENHNRCYECFNITHFNNIAYSRILSKYFSPKTNTCSRTKNSKNPGISSRTSISLDNKKELIGLEIYYKSVSICNECFENNETFKIAPRSIGDIISNIITNDRLDVLKYDIEIMNLDKFNCIKNMIKNDLQTQQNLIDKHNSIINENSKLEHNIELEQEKYIILKEQKDKNNELFNQAKEELIRMSKSFYRQHQTIIENQISKYNELNNASKYNIPECRVCFMREIQVVCHCGHALCKECETMILKEQSVIEKQNIENGIESEQLGGLYCPFCKTYSTNRISIYL